MGAGASSRASISVDADGTAKVTLNVTESVEPDAINLVFVRHAECMHTAALGIPSAILPKFMDETTKDAVAPLVSQFEGVRKNSEGQWKKLAADTPFAVLTKADTPLLPS